MNRQQRRAAKDRWPPQHVIDRLAKRAEATGCDQCGSLLAELLPYAVCRLPDGELSVRCPGCTTGVVPVMIGTYLGGGDPWSKSDRDWFVAHPTRRWRLRDPLLGEMLAFAVEATKLPEEIEAAIRRGGRPAIATLQIAAGKRLRHPVAVFTDEPLDSFTDAGIAKLVPTLIQAERSAASLSDADLERAFAERQKARMQVTEAAVKVARG
jgi:hypothetical protein